MKRTKMRRRGSPETTQSPRAWRVLGLGAAVVAATSCNQFDATRRTGPAATLGDDIYGVFCDRLGASSFEEDLTGASYASICHYDAQGHYGDKVDVTQLPVPTTPAAIAARKLSVAKLERLAQRRGDVVHALNFVFPDGTIPDPTSSAPGATVRLHDALMAFAQGLTPLYETNPIQTGAEPLLPSQTRSLGRLFTALGGASGVEDALSRMWGRRGYRRFELGLGAVRPALAYPKLRPLTTSAISLLAPGGSAANELQQVLGVVKQEMITSTPTISPLPSLTIAPSAAQPNRPRSDLEFASALFLTQNDAFTVGSSSVFIAQRDRRGLVVPAGNTPGMMGTVAPPFVDMDDDGYADVNAFGQFVGADGKPLTLDAPFVIPEETTAMADDFGRPASSATTYGYIDTTKTLIGGLTPHLVPLLDPTLQSAPGDPNGWQNEHETLMYALAGAYELFGDRKQATYDYGKEGPGGMPVSYDGFDPSTSPLPDFIHAAGQILADKDSDALLLGLLDLLQNHESTVARMMGAALRLREIAKEHDAAAMQGTEPLASLPYEVPIWDQMAQVVSDITKHPGLMKALLGALADPTVVTPHGNATDMGDALAKFATFRDQLSYNKHGTHQDGTAGGINGPAVNLTVDPNGNDQSDPRTPVDNTMPRTGTNMSCMQRSLMLIDDANGGPSCNKNNAKVAAKLGPISTSWPIFGNGYGECQLFEFKNLAVFYLDSLLPASHPKRSYLQVKASDLNALMNFLGAFGAQIDDVLQQSSDIAGLTSHPEPYALNRLVFYGASTNNPNYQGMPDFDTVNKGSQVDNFVSSSIDPVSCAWCPPDAIGVPTCAMKSGTVRVRDPNTIFLWERFGFTNYLQPVVRALADVSCDANEQNCDLGDTSGEQIFNAMVHILNVHWPGPDHGPECSSTDMSIYCSGAGVNHYEPILADSFHSDLIPALNEFAHVAHDLSKITIARGPSAGQTWTGADVLEKLTTILFSQDYAQQVGMVDRQGNASTTWVDGTPQAQLTAFDLFADALHKIDTRFANACQKATDMAACMADVEMRQGQWKRARSQLVDEFLSVDGTGPSAKFHNPTVVPTLIRVLELTREQLNANCQGREQGQECTWAKKGLGDELAGVISRPLFASLVDLTEKLRQDETSRRALETFLQYLLQGTNDGGQDLSGLLTTLADVFQVLVDDGDLSPALQAASPGASPNADPSGPGAASIGIEVLKALTSDTYDKYHVMDHVLPKLVTPMSQDPACSPADPCCKGTCPPATNVSPIEVFMDVIADVNRIDASNTSALAPNDYGTIMSTMKGFMLDKTRGMEQLYTIIQERPNP